MWIVGFHRNTTLAAWGTTFRLITTIGHHVWIAAGADAPDGSLANIHEFDRIQCRSAAPPGDCRVRTRKCVFN